MTKKRSQQSLFYFLPKYYLTKGRKGVHFRQGVCTFKLFPKLTKSAGLAHLKLSSPAVMLFRPFEAVGCFNVTV